MVERLIFTIIIVAGLIIAYRLFNVWQMRRVTVADPLLSRFETGRPGVVLFTADHCAPCKFQQRPALKRLLEQTQELQLIEVDVEAEPETAQRWGIMSLPTTYILDKNGQPQVVNHGVTSTEKLKQQVEAVI